MTNLKNYNHSNVWHILLDVVLEFGSIRAIDSVDNFALQSNEYLGFAGRVKLR